MWVGPANQADYSPERRKEFRWFYDYSGGKMTDWGAHHIDIAQWALGHDQTGPVKVSGTGKFTPLVPENFNWQAYLAGQAPLPNGYHTATRVPHQARIRRRLRISPSTISTTPRTATRSSKTAFSSSATRAASTSIASASPANRLRTSPTPSAVTLYQSMIPLYKGKWPGDHMANFFECVDDRKEPISDVYTHHRTMTCCHLCNIALMLGRDLNWDPDKEQFVGDDQATALMSRNRRDAYSLRRHRLIRSGQRDDVCRQPMQALLLTDYRNLELAAVDEPTVGPDDVLVAVAACGICGSDVHGYDGSSGRRIPPIIMGHEAAGVVAQTGANVSRFHVGDRVTFDSTIFCGQCDACRSGNVNLCADRRVLGVSCGEYRQPGAFADYVAVPQQIIYALPDQLPFEHAVLAEPVAVALHAVSRLRISPGDRAVGRRRRHDRLACDPSGSSRWLRRSHRRRLGRRSPPSRLRAGRQCHH